MVQNNNNLVKIDLVILLSYTHAELDEKVLVETKNECLARVGLVMGNGGGDLQKLKVQHCYLTLNSFSIWALS